MHRWEVAFVGAVVVLALTGCSTAAEEPAASTPSASTSTPTAEAVEEATYTVEALRLPGTLSPEEAGQKLFGELLTLADNAGKSDAFKLGFDEAISQGGDSEIAYAKEAASQNAAIFAQALFVPDWESNPNLVKIADDEQSVNYATLSLWAWTYHPDPADAVSYPEDEEPYERSSTVDSVEVISESDTAASVRVVITSHDNRSRNSAQSLTDQPDPNGYQLEATVEIQRVDDSWKISDWVWKSL